MQNKKKINMHAIKKYICAQLIKKKSNICKLENRFRFQCNTNNTHYARTMKQRNNYYQRHDRTVSVVIIHIYGNIMPTF